VTTGAREPVPSPDWLPNLLGKFVVFDGPDGSGKTTQFNRFLNRCRRGGLSVCDVREPGGTRISERVRDILLDPALSEMTLRAEMLLYMAARAQLVDERLAPALAANELVLADRFVSSTLAYQGAGGGLPFDEIYAVAKIACRQAWPDLVVIFDVDEQTAARRMGLLRDRMEAKGAAFHRKVRAGFLDQAKRGPEKCVVIDATQDEDAVERMTLEALRRKFAPKSGKP